MLGPSAPCCRVYRPGGTAKTLMHVVGVFMCLVCTAATIAAVRGIINK
jgi:hypothetical protein